ncbi:MAG: zinc-ribbon domain-containing protein, partial [Proteobacteria bacterium]|nr:zinc-ribbon domain-containing protein [Pseudomonadota bacterium]
PAGGGACPAPGGGTPCPDCGLPINADAKFCPYCGHQILVFQQCLRCGKNLAPSAKFCSRCGTPVTQAEPQEKFCPKCGTGTWPRAGSATSAGRRWCWKRQTGSWTAPIAG